MRLFVVFFISFFLSIATASAQNAAVTCREGKAEAAIAACTSQLARKDLAPAARVLTLINRGVVYEKMRDLDHALVDFDAAIKLDPRSAIAFGWRGSALRTLKQYDLSIESYTTAISLQPQVAIYRTGRGSAYRWRGDLDKAMVDLNAAIKLNPNFFRSYGERGIVYRRQSDFLRALADHNYAVKLAPNRWEPYSYRGFTHEARNDLKAALSDFRKAQLLAQSDQFARTDDIVRSIARIETKLANLNAQPAKDAKAATASQRIALVIGNGNYSNAGALANPQSDATAVGKALRDIGFTQVTLKLDQSREQLMAALKEFAALADKADWAVIYYAGHGIEVGGTNYLVPVDANLTTDRDASFEAVTLDQVLLSVEGASKMRLVILDACRDNPFARKMVKSTGARTVSSGLGNIEPEGATLVVYAAKHGQTAEDGKGTHSPFAASLVKNIQARGLEVNLMFRKVRDEVLAATGKRQEPFTYGSLPGETFYFQPN